VSPDALARLNAARFVSGYLSPKLADFTADTALAAELVRSVQRHPLLRPHVAALIDDTARQWDELGGQVVDAADFPGISREGVCLLAAWRWAEGVLDEPPRLAAHFEAWRLRKVFGNVDAGRGHDRGGEHYGRHITARELADAAAAFGIDARPPSGPLTFDELRAFADELARRVAEPSPTAAAPADLELVRATPTLPTPTQPPPAAAAELPPLDKASRAILQRLAEREGDVVPASDIAAALDAGDVPAGIRTVRGRLNNLASLGLVNKPLGERRGYALTPAGRDRLANVRHITD
jgi:hypothetical protein